MRTQTKMRWPSYYQLYHFPDESSDDIDKEIQALDDIEEGDIVRGYVKTISDVGLFVK